MRNEVKVEKTLGVFWRSEKEGVTRGARDKENRATTANNKPRAVGIPPLNSLSLN